MQVSAAGRQTIVSTSLTIMGSAIAAAVLLVMFLGGSKAAFGVAGAILFVAALIACGNIRLFCLWGLILTAPLALNLSFFIAAHMGGAGAITIDAIDVFMLPLLFFLVRDFYVGYRRDVRIPNVLYWWLGLTFLGVITMVFGPMRQVAALEVFRMLKLALLFCIIVNEVVRIRQFKHVVAALMIGMAIQCVVGILQYTLDLNLGAQILGEVTQADSEYTSRATYLESTYTNRIGGLIGHPNLLAIFLTMLIPIGVAILFTDIKPYLKLSLIFVLMMGVACLILTLSRSGWICFAVAFAVLMGISFTHVRLRRKYILARILVMLTTVVLVAAMSGPILKRIYASDEGAVSFRFEWMEVAVKMAADEPVLGVGLNSFVWFMPPYTRYKTYQSILEHHGSETYLPVVHNIYLLVWAEQGTVGLLLYMVFYIKLLLIAWRGVALYTEPFLSMVNIGCLAGLVALAVDGLVSFFIRNPNCGRVTFIIAALVVAMQWWHEENTPKAIPISKAG